MLIQTENFLKKIVCISHNLRYTDEISMFFGREFELEQLERFLKKPILV